MQLRRMLRDIPPGRKVSLEISRDGNIQTLAVQLVDRKAMEHDIWTRLGIDVDGIAPVAPPAHDGHHRLTSPFPSGFHMPSSPAPSTWARWLSRSPRRWPSTSASRAA
jgi:hypothetical protein